ncbi:hypothetical protein RIF29_22524 [Crotalaria pallida]|uniref:Uncharacterized protein n=1 Tax=Crotalaria pallida TaxID=3830 RepID=A0AAN9F9D6_CROPI
MAAQGRRLLLATLIKLRLHRHQLPPLPSHSSGYSYESPLSLSQQSNGYYTGKPIKQLIQADKMTRFIHARWITWVYYDDPYINYLPGTKPSPSVIADEIIKLAPISNTVDPKPFIRGVNKTIKGLIKDDAAIGQGILAGDAATALLRLSSHVPPIKEKLKGIDEKLGADSFQKALAATTELITCNKIDKVDLAIVYDLKRDKNDNLLEAGVEDPVEVTRCILQHAAQWTNSTLVANYLVATGQLIRRPHNYKQIYLNYCVFQPLFIAILVGRKYQV